MATPGGLVTFMRVQLGKPIASPVVLGQVTEKFRDAVKTEAERQQIPIYQFQHKERQRFFFLRRAGNTAGDLRFTGAGAH